MCNLYQWLDSPKSSVGNSFVCSMWTLPGRQKLTQEIAVRASYLEHYEINLALLHTQASGHTRATTTNGLFHTQVILIIRR